MRLIAEAYKVLRPAVPLAKNEMLVTHGPSNVAQARKVEHPLVFTMS